MDLGREDTTYTLWSCHSNFVSNLPAPLQCGPAGWMALLLTKAGDVETSPGPTTSHKRVWICDICYKQIHVRKQISIRCTSDAQVSAKRNRQRIQTCTSHRHNTTPPLQTLVQAPCPLPTHTTATHRQTSNTPPVPTGLVKSKANPLIHPRHPEPNTYSTNPSHPTHLTYP